MDKPGEVNLEKANWEKMRRMSMKELLTNIGVLVGFIILCWGGSGIMSVITVDSFGDDSEW